VVAGDTDLRRGQPGHEIARGRVLAAAGALGEIARVDQNIRLGRENVGDDGLGDGRLIAAEVDVGDVGERFHGDIKRKT
jgi:hypothetical protein